MTLLAKLENAIQELEKQKQEIFNALENSCWPDDRSLERIPEKQETLLFELIEEERVIPEQAPLPPKIHQIYQHWVSATRTLISKNQPERLSEFDELYNSVKQTLSQRYITKYAQFQTQSQIEIQFDLLSAIPNHLRYSLYDVELEAYSVLIEDELQAAKHLLSKGFLRGAGGLAGVLLERHLKNLLSKHTPPITFRKNATISPLNDACKETIYDLITWRKVQHLLDLRNLCSHDKTSEPTKSQVAELIVGVSSILKMHSP